MKYIKCNTLQIFKIIYLVSKIITDNCWFVPFPWQKRAWRWWRGRRTAQTGLESSRRPKSTGRCDRSSKREGARGCSVPRTSPASQTKILLILIENETFIHFSTIFIIVYYFPNSIIFKLTRKKSVIRAQKDIQILDTFFRSFYEISCIMEKR